MVPMIKSYMCNASTGTDNFTHPCGSIAGQDEGAQGLKRDLPTKVSHSFEFHSSFQLRPDDVASIVQPDRRRVGLSDLSSPLGAASIEPINVNNTFLTPEPNIVLRRPLDEHEDAFCKCFIFSFENRW